MTTIERSIVIKAPVREVFSYLEDPVHLPEIWPSMVEVKEVKPLPKGGYRYHWLYKMAGMKFEGETETLEKMEQRIACDHQYIREWSLWMDLKILARTLSVVFSQKNAY